MVNGRESSNMIKDAMMMKLNYMNISQLVCEFINGDRHTCTYNIAITQAYIPYKIRNMAQNSKIFRYVLQ
jgi:hypothetical protein